MGGNLRCTGRYDPPYRHEFLEHARVGETIDIEGMTRRTAGIDLARKPSTTAGVANVAGRAPDRVV
jgi:hypothetical protein